MSIGQSGGRTPPISRQYSDMLYGLEKQFLPYEELVAQGRLGRNKFNLKPGESRFSKDLSGFIGSLEAADPILASYRSVVESGLEGLEDGLPADFRRTLTQEVRASQASRGIIDSDMAAIEESARLIGGSELIRATRLQEAQNYLSGVTNLGVAALVPGAAQMLQGSVDSWGQRTAYSSGKNQMYGSLFGAGAGLALGGLTGGMSSLTSPATAAATSTDVGF